MPLFVWRTHDSGCLRTRTSRILREVQDDLEPMPSPAQPPHRMRLMTRFFTLPAIVLLLASCGFMKSSTANVLREAFADLRSTAQGVIADPNRRDRYLQFSESLESELMAFERYAANFVDDYRLAFTNHGADQAELRKLSATFRDQQREMQDRWVELHLAMAATLTAEEWQPLSISEARIVEGLLNATTGSTR